MAKVTRELARSIYNRYSQIDDAEELIKKLSGFVNKELAEARPSLTDQRYHPFGMIELHVPTFQEGQFKGSYRILGISYSSALKVLKNHVKQLKRELADLQKDCDENEI